MRGLRQLLLCIGILSSLVTTSAYTQELNLGNLPDDLTTQFAVGPFAEAYSVSGRINPFYLRGDFDGDGKPDYAILIASNQDHSKGIAIWLSTKKRFVVLGAGHPFKFGRSDKKGATDFDFIDIWQVYGRKPVERGVAAGPPPKLLGEAILAGKTESASGLLYWDGKEFAWYQQGD